MLQPCDEALTASSRCPADRSSTSQQPSSVFTWMSWDARDGHPPAGLELLCVRERRHVTRHPWSRLVATLIDSVCILVWLAIIAAVGILL